jgi:hypothetical protein
MKLEQRAQSLMSKDDLLAIIRACARKLGRIPMMKDLRAMAGIGPSRINRRCGSLGRAIREAGLETVGNGYSVDTEDILRDYAQVARKLGKLPVKGEYEAHGRHSCNPFYRRFERWQDVPTRFVKEAERYGLDKEYADVVEMAKMPRRRQMGVPAREHVFNKEQGNTQPSTQAETVVATPLEAEGTWRTLPNRPLYGPLMAMPLITHAPTNELELIHLFGKIGPLLGFVVLRIKGTYPDCEALRRVRGGFWQRVRIEFEIESANFPRHGHAPKKCDMIVCWRHNWQKCPDGLEVLELQSVMGKLR